MGSSILCDDYVLSTTNIIHNRSHTVMCNNFSVLICRYYGDKKIILIIILKFLYEVCFPYHPCFLYHHPVIDCGRLSAPQNGAVQFESTTYTSIAFYQCSQGHILEGSESRTCQANGQWSGVAPTCNG